MTDPFKPSPSLLVKLGSIAVHDDEMNEYHFDPRQHGFVHDRAALETLLTDAEVIEWRKQMSKMGMVPVKRT